MPISGKIAVDERTEVVSCVVIRLIVLGKIVVVPLCGLPSTVARELGFTVGRNYSDERFVLIGLLALSLST